MKVNKKKLKEGNNNSAIHNKKEYSKSGYGQLDCEIGENVHKGLINFLKNHSNFRVIYENTKLRVEKNGLIVVAPQ